MTDTGIVHPTDEYVKTVCAIGQGELCCRYLTMSPQGWSCEKHGSLQRTLDIRAENKTMVARGDNCDGLSAR